MNAESRSSSDADKLDWLSQRQERKNFHVGAVGFASIRPGILFRNPRDFHDTEEGRNQKTNGTSHHFIDSIRQWIKYNINSGYS